MKILTILTIPFAFNGISNVVLNYYNNLESEEIEMDFAFPENSNKERISEQIDFQLSKVYFLPLRTKNILQYRKNLKKILSNTQYDVVHIHGNSSTMVIETTLAKQFKIKKIITHAHNTFSKYPKIDYILSKPFLNSFTDPLACGVAAGNFLYKGRDFIVLENGINIEKYKYSEIFRNQIRNCLDLKENDLVIGHVGHFTFQKNQEYLISLLNRISEKLTNVKLLLIGDGENRTSIEDLVRQLGLESKVRFLGNRSDVNKIYSALDILVMPSRFEGLPLTLVEAQASDLKCFVSDKITKEVNLTDTVEFFNIDKFDELERMIMLYVLNPINRNKNNNYKRIEASKYNIKNTVNKLEEIYCSDKG